MKSLNIQSTLFFNFFLQAVDAHWQPTIDDLSECKLFEDGRGAIAGVTIFDWTFAMEELKDTVVDIFSYCTPNAQRQYLRAFHSIPKQNEMEAKFLAILTLENQEDDNSWKMGQSSSEWDGKVIALLSRFYL